MSQDLRSFVMRRFLSQTGKWDKLVALRSPVPLARPMDTNMGSLHEAVAFAGRLWWVDVTCGALSVDPFTDRPELRFTELPRGSVTEPMDKERREELSRYRRIGVSEGRLRYAEVSQEEPFLLSSFTLDDDGSCWTLEHRVALRQLWPHEDLCENKPQIAVVDPLNASVMHLAIGRQVLSLDMVTGNLLRRVLICDHDPTKNGVLIKPCVLPPWLQSSKIPSAGNHLSQGDVYTCLIMRSAFVGLDTCLFILHIR